MQNSEQNYYVYILTNYRKNVLYIGITNNLAERLKQHENCFNPKSFNSKYNVFYLVYYELFDNPNSAIEREKQLKKWRREKKDDLIKSFNPKLEFLNGKFR